MIPDYTNDLLKQIETKNPRQRKLFGSLIKHLHDFIRDVEPSEQEWLSALQFLTAIGQSTTERRDEMMLLSDVMGVTMLVDAINHQFPEGATDTTVTGPFHSEETRVVANGESIAQGPEWQRDERAYIHGRVLDLEGNPVAGAKISLWQPDDLGLYDYQDAKQPDINLRGVLTTGEAGDYSFKTVRPLGYSVPTDGPVGSLLKAWGRTAMRPAHIHAIVTANGYHRLVTHLFVEGDPYLETDAVFGVKPSLIVPFERVTDAQRAKSLGIPGDSFYDVEFNFVLVAK